MDQVHVIRHQVLVEGRSQRSVAREHGVSRNTVRKYMDQSAPRRVEGKAGTPVELGVPVALIEDQLPVHPSSRGAVARRGRRCGSAAGESGPGAFPDLRACSFDRGFHSPENRIRLDQILDLNVLPKKGYLSVADREREAEEAFAAARRAHPAVESAINALEHRGLDRVRSRGADGFERTVAISVLAANLHRLGRLLQRLERKRQRRRRAA